MINVCSIQVVHLRIIYLVNFLLFLFKLGKYLLTYTLAVQETILKASYQIRTVVFVGRNLSSNFEGMGFKLNNKIRNSIHIFEIWILLFLF